MTAGAGAGADIQAGSVYWDLQVRTDALAAATPQVVAAERALMASGQRVAGSMQQVTTQATETAGALNMEAVAVDQLTKELAILKQGYAGAKAESAQMADRILQLEAALQKKKATTNATTQAMGKARNGLISIALASTQTTGAVGNLIQGMLLFGAGSGAVLGVAAAVSLLARGYQMLTEESRKAAEQVKNVREEQAKAREDAKSPVQRTGESLTTLVNERTRLSEQISAEQAALERVRSAPGTRAESRDEQESQHLNEINRLTEERKKLELDIDTARKARTEATNQSRVEELRTLVEARQLGLASNADRQREQELVAGLRALEGDTTKTLRERVEARRVLAELTAAERDRAKELRDIVFAGRQAAADLTKGLLDNAELALDRFDADVRTRLQTMSGAARDAAEKAFAQQRVPIQENVTAARALDSVVGVEQASSIERLNEAMASLVRAQAELTRGGQAYEAIERRITELEEKKTALIQAEITSGKIIADRNAAAAQAEVNKAKASERHRTNQQQIVDLIEASVRGALQFAQAWDLVSEKTANVLQNVLALATDLPKFTEELTKLQSGKNGSVQQVISAGLPVIGGILSIGKGLADLFGGGGPDPREEERLRRQDENTRAIQKLTDTLGEFGLPGVSGDEFTTASAAAEQFGNLSNKDFFEKFGERGRTLSFLEVDQARVDAQLKLLGTSRDELQSLASALGLSVNFLTNDTVELHEAFQELDKALKETQLTKIAETFSGQRSAQQLEEEALRLTNPVAILERRRDLQGQVDQNGDLLGSPALQKALAGLDLNTAEGRAQAQANILAVVQALKNNQLKAEDLGGLDADQFQQAIREILGLLQDADTKGADGATSNFSVARTITDNQADQLIGLANTQVVYLSEISARSTEIRDMLGGVLLAFTGIQPPTVPLKEDETVTAGAGGVVLNINGDINLTVQPAPGASPTEIGAEAAEQIIEAVIARLGDDVRTRRVLKGQVGVL